MIRTVLLALLLVLTKLETSSQEKYFVSFNNKLGTPFTLENPTDYLTIKSVERRVKQGIDIDYTDLPVSPNYINQLKETGAKVLFTLKWFNGAVIETTSEAMVLQIENLESVKEIRKVFEPGLKSAPMPEEEIFPIYTVAKDPNDFYFYGSSSTQIKMLNGHIIHNKGFRGKGITIGVLDAGFYNTNTLPAFDSLWKDERVIFTKDFVTPNSNIYQEHTHGMIVLSAMVGNLPGQLIGSAPEANYILIRSEDANSEQIIEEYNWAAAAELADSLGVDIINSSLGYYLYDAPWQSHTYSQMNGISTPIAQAANFAGEKGILVVSSAGNEGTNDWKYIITPADAINTMGVGAVNELGQYASFSSIGPSADGRIKPDVMAMGQSTVIQSPNGQIGSANGTSLSAPIISGLAACLWQALPDISVKELKQRIIFSSSNFFKPNNQIGYGLPNFSLALDSLPKISTDKDLLVYPNPTTGEVTFFLPQSIAVDSSVILMTSTGIVIKTESIDKSKITHSLKIPDNYPAGLYLVKLVSGNINKSGKVIKISNGIE